jgi:hypothetical protein
MHYSLDNVQIIIKDKGRMMTASFHSATLRQLAKSGDHCICHIQDKHGETASFCRIPGIPQGGMSLRYRVFAGDPDAL